MCRGVRVQHHPHPSSSSLASSAYYYKCNCHENDGNSDMHGKHMMAQLVSTALMVGSTPSSSGAVEAAEVKGVSASRSSSQTSTTAEVDSTSSSSSMLDVPPPPPPPPALPPSQQIAVINSNNRQQQQVQRQRQRQRAFLKRSMASRTVSFIEAEVNALASQCHFVQQPQQEQSILSLHRSQIVIDELIGEGGFSHVYSVDKIILEDDEEEEEHKHHQPLVIKHLKPDIVNVHDRKKFYAAAADLVWEARCLAALDHPNIIKLRGVAKNDVQCYGDGTHDGFFLLLDRLDETLTHRLIEWRKMATRSDEQQSQASMTTSVKDDHPPATFDMVQEKLDLAVQVASALQYLHDRNIIFRDIKPSNVGIAKKWIRNDDGTVEERTQAVLLDFGLCRELPFSGTTDNAKKDETFLMSMVGTRRFLAPEIALGEGYNLQADVYSFTLMCYELMTLITPFAMYSREMHDWLVVRDNVRPTLHESWSDDVRSLFEQGWTRCPTDRPTMSEILHQLESMLSDATHQHHQQPEESQELCDSTTGIKEPSPSSNDTVDMDAEDVATVVDENIQQKAPPKGSVRKAKKASGGKRKHTTRKVWFHPGIFESLPSLLRKASSSFYEGNSCCTTTSNPSLSRSASDVSIAKGAAEAE